MTATTGQSVTLVPRPNLAPFLGVYSQVNPLMTDVFAPDLWLDFTHGNFDSRITYTGQNGTYFNSAGTLTAATTNVARFDYDPSTLAAKGLLIEEARTNSLFSSEQFDAADWAKTDVTVTSNAATSPAGTVTADLLTEGVAGTAVTGQSQPCVAGNTQTGTFFVKKSGTGAPQWVKVQFISAGGNTRAWFDLTNGVLGTVGGSAGTHTVIGATIQAINNSWYRVSLTVTIATDTSCSWNISSAAADNSNTRVNNATYLVWGGDRQVGGSVTSYIPTTVAAVTRAADVASMTGSNFSSWFNATQGTFVVSLIPPTTALDSAPTTANDGTDGNRIGFDTTSTGFARLVVDVASVSQVLLGTGGVIQGSINKLAGAYQANNFAISKNGGSVSTDVSGSIPTVDRLQIGSRVGTNFLNGWIQSIAYYRNRLPNSVLQSLSR